LASTEKIYFEAKKTVKGIPNISTNKEIKKALTRPYSTHLIFLFNDNGINNAMKNIIQNITICHCRVMMVVSVVPVK
jgi:hypothetical protein